MDHSRTHWCVGIAAALLFTGAAYAQEASGAQGIDRQYSPLAVPKVSVDSEYRVDSLSRFDRTQEISQLIGNYPTGNSPFLNVKEVRLDAAAKERSDEAEPYTEPQSTPPAASGANAPSTPSPSPEIRLVGNPTPLSFHGITFYGLFDVGAMHETHGATYDGNSPQIGIEDPISKNSNHALTHYSEDGLGQSYLGLRGKERLYKDVSLIFKLEPGVELLDMKFTNSIQSLVNNNGVAAANQSTNFDTNRSGRVDNGDAYYGLSVDGEQNSASLVYGRVTSLMGENVTKYDFEPRAYAFSLVAYITQVDGGGDSEDFRLDSALKFSGQSAETGSVCSIRSPDTTQLFNPTEYMAAIARYRWDMTSAEPRSMSSMHAFMTASPLPR